ncbi:hypothetical protein D9B85_14015, partial [Corynebacterium diphtheriae]
SALIVTLFFGGWLAPFNLEISFIPPAFWFIIKSDVWFVIPQFLGFLIFVVAGVAVTHRHPFDQPEAEQELAEGYHVEYGGMKWGMFFVAEYVNVVLISALIVTLFFGGWLAPFNLEISFIPPAFWFIIK